MKTRLVLAALFLFALVSSPARADIIFGSGNSPNASVNIGSYTQNNATTATGKDLASTDDVLLAMSDVAMTVPAMGAARIEALATLFTTVMFTPIGDWWETIELDAKYGGTVGTFVLKALDQNNVEWVSGSFALGNGSNRVWAQGINGQQIKKLTVQASGALIQDIRQIRILAVPEPTSIAILGVGVLGIAGFGAFRRRKKS